MDVNRLEESLGVGTEMEKTGMTAEMKLLTPTPKSLLTAVKNPDKYLDKEDGVSKPVIKSADSNSGGRKLISEYDPRKEEERKNDEFQVNLRKSLCKDDDSAKRKNSSGIDIKIREEQNFLKEINSKSLLPRPSTKRNPLFGRCFSNDEVTVKIFFPDNNQGELRSIEDVLLQVNEVI